MDLDKEGVDNYGFEEEDSEPVERVTMLVVPEAELEGAFLSLLIIMKTWTDVLV